ncbi:DUF748 domain-containing protein [Dyella sp. SG609]|uniref:DUF748 domain-containing protein n=1 Tax=Dyella sp. SG609 TaxID=2587018 RepID=UPI001446B7DF|nr:DUF748 domain-containing protein [Dyella sp. SG609]NKJ22113.1 uncharacterized protein involved in outer membrane biogenesis [Dyella sp. SG609]
MADQISSGSSRLTAARTRALTVYRSRRTRKTALIAAIVLVLFGLFGFLAAPSIIRGQIEKHASAALDRPVTLGKVHLNPYTLRLQLDQLHIGERDGKTSFVDVDQIVANTSWTSLFRLAPVLDELSLQRPRIHIARTADQRFNFSDIIERYASQPAAPDAKPARFALSNISVHGGDIVFDDQAAKASHHVEQLELGIPFLANLPSSTDVFVKPLLALKVDGSPLRIEGQTKPFASNRESAIGFQLDRLDLPRYLGYVPKPLPIAIPKGLLSGKLELNFVQTPDAPQVRLTGNLQLDDFALDSSKGEPIARLGHGTAELADVQPLVSRYRLGALKLEQAQVYYTASEGGHSNYDTLTAPSAPADPAKKAAPTDLRIASIALTGSAIHYTDATQNKLDLADLHGSLLGLSMLAAPPAKLDLAGQLFGGDIGAKGTLDLAAATLKAALSLKQVDMVPLQAMAGSAMAARAAKGKLDANGQLQLDWGKATNVHLAPAQATVSDFALEAGGKGQAAPVAWGKLQADIEQIDLASRQARLKSLVGTGLSLDVQRAANGTISLTELFAPPKTAAKAAAPRGKARPADAGPAWQWSIAHLGVDNGAVRFADHAVGNGKPAVVEVTALKGGIDELSDKFNQQRAMKLDGSIGKGTFSLAGNVQPSPALAELDVTTRGLDIATFAPYISVPLNVTISSARLSGKGKLHYDGRSAEPKFGFKGNAALERVRVQDKVTGDDFLRWSALNAGNLDVAYGSGTPRMHVGSLVLSAFYARMIVNANGRLNLADVVAKPEQEAPVSVTRAETNAPAAPKVSKTTTETEKPTESIAPAADIQLGQITLLNGQLNYTDNFIKPNYTANLTKVTGKIGAFGTAGGPPAEVAVQAQLDDNSPVDISGSMNPLAPVAFLDIQGKANEVELTRLSAYSSKYTGYPITAGKLTVDVKYNLDQRKLKADNHIYITQLTFGDRIEAPGISHLPVKLAVALLKDTQGNIDVNVPVSGSLDDPQFSMGGLIWRAIGNLIVKAVTSPFRLLGSAFGGGDHEDLGYVEFEPGSAVLNGAAQERLGKVVAMLNQKTSLTLDIVGRADPAQDQNGLRKVTVQDMIRKEKLLDDGGKNADTSPAALAAVAITPDQEERYLARAYKHADDIDKPRNALGLKKSLEPDEMRALLETNVKTDDAAMRDLAERRANAVRDWLKGKLPDNRYGLKDPKLTPEGIDDKGKTTRVDFGLH